MCPSSVHIADCQQGCLIILRRALNILMIIYLQDVGLGSEALTYTVAIGSPAGAIVLFLYARSIKLVGPQTTLRISELACIILMAVMVALISLGYLQGGIPAQVIVVWYYSFREM